MIAPPLLDLGKVTKSSSSSIGGMTDAATISKNCYCNITKAHVANMEKKDLVRPYLQH
jgi:hypothetical protein